VNSGAPQTDAKSVVFYAAFDAFRQVTAPLRRLFEARGWTYSEYVANSPSADRHQALSRVVRADLVIVWNGEDPGCQWVQRVRDARRRATVVADWGFVQSGDHLHLDPLGMHGRSSLCGALDWVGEREIEALRGYADLWRRNLGWRWKPQQDRIVAPLQREYSAATYAYSPVRTMQEFVEHVEAEFPRADIAFTVHPREPRISLKTARGRILRAVSTIQAAQDASLVYGINSGALYETSLLGVPTRAIGDCPLGTHSQSQDRVLAACLARQRPLTDPNLASLFAAVGVQVDAPGVGMPDRSPIGAPSGDLDPRFRRV
jgi:hypothetical protein